MAVSLYLRALSAAMKADIHPNYQETDIVCACGAVYIHERSLPMGLQ
jgi:hypothetical protein